MPTRTVRRDWFVLGAKTFRRAAIAHALLGDKLPAHLMYPCPLRGLEFTWRDLGTRLTFEDVPPARVGGRPIILTCQPCNNVRGGSEVDRDAVLRERWVDSMTGLSGVTPVEGTLTVGGVVLAGTVWGGPGQLGFECSRSRSERPRGIGAGYRRSSQRQADDQHYSGVLLVARGSVLRARRVPRLVRRVRVDRHFPRGVRPGAAAPRFRPSRRPTAGHDPLRHAAPSRRDAVRPVVPAGCQSAGNGRAPGCRRPVPAHPVGPPRRWPAGCPRRWRTSRCAGPGSSCCDPRCGSSRRPVSPRPETGD